MKSYLFAFASVLSLTASAADIQISNLSKSDVEKVGNEFAVNFAHTTVSAPETDGVWGLEVGVVGGTTQSPNLKKVVNASGGDGKDFKNIYHAGLMVRAHFPLDIFVEGTLLPEREISDVDIKSNSFGIGWNAGAFFGLPLDLAAGINMSRGDVSFHQDADLSDLTQPVPASDIKVKTKNRIMWLGVSKTFVFVTPYAKVGYSHTEADINVDAIGIFNYTTSQKESVDKNGGYLALGANLQLLFFKLGLEWSQMNTVKNATAKVSLDF